MGTETAWLCGVPMGRKLIVSVVVIVAFVGASTGVAIWLIRTAPAPAESDVSRPPLLVKGLRIEPQTVVEPISGFGTARPLRQARLSAQVSGEVVAVADDLHVGMVVEEGQVLVQIDPREYRQRLDSAQSDLAAVKAQLAQMAVEERNLERLIETARRELTSVEWEHRQVESLYEQGAAPKREYEQSRLAVERMRRTLQSLENQLALLPTRRSELEATVQNRTADIEIATLQLARCTIRAPFAGLVEDKSIEVGERVQPGTPLLSVLDPDIVEVPVKVPVSLLPFVKTGRECRLFTSGSDEAGWTGTVKRIAPAADSQTRTTDVFVRIDNRVQERVLRPGVFVLARIDGPTWADVFVVPRGSVQEGRVFVYRDGRAAARNVRVTRWLQEQGIVAGLERGDVVITSNLDALYDGAPVRLEVEMQAENARADRVATADDPLHTAPADEERPDKVPVR